MIDRLHSLDNSRGAEWTAPGATSRREVPDARSILQALSPLERASVQALLGREIVKDKSYRALPLGMEVAAYLRANRLRLTKRSYEDCESGLHKFVMHHADLEIADFEPPVGTERLEEFFDHQWGHREPRTYNKNLSYHREFFKFEVLRGKLHGDPTLPMKSAKTRQPYRSVFSSDYRTQILALGPDPDNPRRDRIALKLLVKYAVRKGSLQENRFEHWDRNARQVTLKLKGGRWGSIPVVDKEVWDDLEKLMLEIDAQPTHYLMARRKTQMSWRGRDEVTGENIVERRELVFPDKPMGAHGLHNWWYRCLERAGVVGEGVTAGEKMHKARHTAGQVLLNQTGGNLKAVQRLLLHSSMQTTGDIYVDWDIEQLAEVLRDLEDDPS